MRGQSIVDVLLAAALVTFGMCLFVEGTFDWFTVQELPEMTLPEVCGTRSSVSNSSNVTHYRSQNESTEDTPKLPAGVGISELDFPDGFWQQEQSWPWVVRIGDNAAGVLISQQHVVTVAHCLANYRRWFGGFYSFGVKILDQEKEVVRVQVQSTEYNPMPLALLTLGSDNTSVPSPVASPPVCVGPYRHELIPVAVGWNENGFTHKHIVSIYRSGQCASFHENNYRYDLMLCGTAGDKLCGGPLLQVADGRWMLVALGSGDATPVARYVRLDPARKWLEELE